MKEILPGIWTWSWFSDEKGYPFNGFILESGSSRVLIDPVRSEGADAVEIQKRAPFEAIILTNKDHERMADEWRQKSGAKIWIHEADESLLKNKADHTFQDGFELPCGLKAIHLSDQKSPGESALYLASKKILFLGDALIGHPAGKLRLLPPPKYKDIKKAKVALKKLDSYQIDSILVGDGEHILTDAKTALEVFLNSPGEPIITMA